MFSRQAKWTATILFMAQSNASADVRYAKPGGSGDCLSWATACTLTQAVSGAAAGDSIWVAAGTHPSIGLTPGVNLSIIGGFAGTETSASQSKPAVNVTTIDPTIGGPIRRGAYSVDHDRTMLFRGLRFVNGNDVDDDWGGGAVRVLDSSPTIVDCVFEYNTAAYLGGAIAVFGDSSSPLFVSCVFRRNGSTPTHEGPYNGGAIAHFGGSLTVVNALFHDNIAGEGGAVYIGSDTRGESFTNCTIADNVSVFRPGGGVATHSPVASFRNCILWGNRGISPVPPFSDIYHQIRDHAGASVAFSDVELGWPGTGNINADPMFQDSASGNYKLSAVSPCLDVGDNSTLTTAGDPGDLDWDGITAEELPKDLNRSIRKYNGVVDMGAYEAKLAQ